MKVIFVHWGKPDYLKYAIDMAKRYDNNVILLRNSKRIYNSFKLSRWFVLRDYFEKRNFERFLYLDSDCLLYTNVENDFRDCDFTLSKMYSGHTMFVNNPDVLSELCEYIENNVGNLDLIKKTKKRFQEDAFPDYMDDSVLLENFAHNNYKFKVRDTFELVNGTIYDHDITSSDGFGMDLGTKTLSFINGQPFGRIGFDLIRFNTLHFKGEHIKKFIKGLA